jgi:hypothetical protein
MDKLVIDGNKIYENLKYKDILDENFIFIKEENGEYIFEYLNTTIKSQLKILDSNELNDYGDYACKSTIILESLILTFLNKLESPHFPKLLDTFRYEDEILLQTEKINGEPYHLIKDRLNDSEKDVIVFQILYSLYESSIFDFTHGNLIESNVIIEIVDEEEIEYNICGESHKMFNCGINVKLINFQFSRITAYKTYIFNENERKEKFSNRYEVPFDQNEDIRKILHNVNFLSLQMREKLKKSVNFNSGVNLTVNKIISFLFGFKYFNQKREKKTMNEDKIIDDQDEDIYPKYIIDFPNVEKYGILTKRKKAEFLDYLLGYKYNRLLYKYLTYFPDIKLDKAKINIGIDCYSKNRKIINKLNEVYNKTKDFIKPIKQFKSIERIQDDIELKEIFDPIMLQYYDTDEWLSQKNNIIFDVDGSYIGSNRSYFFNVPESNLISKVIFDNGVVNYSKSLHSTRYINLNKYGISNVIIEYEYFLASLSSNVIKIIKVDKIIGINYEQLSNNPKTYETKYNTMIFDKSHSLTNYSHQWDSAINGYLRSIFSGEDFTEGEFFLDLYERFGTYPEEAIQNIKEAIKEIDDAFLDSYIVSKEIVVYRGVTDGKLYDGINPGFISTSQAYKIAYAFSGGSSVYEMHVLPGVPYLYMRNFSKHEEEEEILLPRNLKVTLREKKGKNYIVDVSLSSENQFDLKKEYKSYDVCLIKDFNIEVEKKEMVCYRNTIKDGNIIDDLTGDIIDFSSSINFDGRCYNKSSLVLLLVNGYYGDFSFFDFVDPFTRIKFPSSVISEIIDLLNEESDKDKLLIKFSSFGNFEIVNFLLEKGANIHSQNDEALIEASKTLNLDIIKLLIKNGANVHAQNNKALFEASKNGDVEIISYLTNLTSEI